MKKIKREREAHHQPTYDTRPLRRAGVSQIEDSNDIFNRALESFRVAVTFDPLAEYLDHPEKK